MSVVLNEIRRGAYLDSVALMRLSRTVAGLPGVVEAALMIGTPSNKKIMQDAGILKAEGEAAQGNDLVIAIKASDEAAARAALDEAKKQLDAPKATAQESGEQKIHTLHAAAKARPDANLALISVPGPFAVAEARNAIANGLHVMIFSDNVAIEHERALKEEAKARGLLVMGPDCGTAILNGVPLAFANVIAKGDIGIIAASGTGLQEVSTLIGRHGKGITHGIGVGGRDLKEAVGGITTMMAIDALDRDPETKHIVLISKPPAAKVAEAIVARIGKSKKQFTLCFIGLDRLTLPKNAVLASTLTEAAEKALDRLIVPAGANVPALNGKRQKLRGLYSGGTLSAEAQVILRRKGIEVASNAPIPGVPEVSNDALNVILDLGADEYTVGRPHPMIDPSLRNEMLKQALAADDVAVILLDVVIGYGAHEDPAGSVAEILSGSGENGPVVIASVTGTEDDPQNYSAQVRRLREAGAVVESTNARAAELAANLLSASAGAERRRQAN
jgi:succinyl-CoA synthetase alpha subunit